MVERVIKHKAYWVIIMIIWVAIITTNLCRRFDFILLLSGVMIIVLLLLILNNHDQIFKR